MTPMRFPTILLFSVIASHVPVIESALPAHYNDLEEYLLSRMNFSIDPCDDFYTYACGNSDDYRTTIAMENPQVLKNGLNKLIASGRRDYPPTSAYGKALRLYEACVNENLTRADTAVYTKKNVHAFLKKFNFPINFFFDDNANVTINREKFSEILKYVHDIFAVEPFFELKGVPAKTIQNDEKWKSNVIFLFTNVKKSFEAGLVYECNSSKLLETFIQGVRNYTVAMGWTATDCKIEETARKLMEFELRLLGIPCGNNNITITNDSAEPKLEELTVANFGIDLNNYVRSLIETGIGNHEVSFLFNIRYLLEVLESTSDADLLRYIYFRIFRINVGDVNCFFSLNPMKLVKSRIYTDLKYSSAAERENFSDGMKFTDVIDIVKEQLRNMVLTTSWIQADKHAYDTLTKKFKIMRAEVAIEKNLLNDTYLDQYYDTLQFNDNDHFLDMWSKAQKFAMYEKVRSIVRDRTDFEDDLTLVNAGYMPALNKFVIYDGWLNAPIYDKKYDFSFNFGSISAVTGHEIAHSVDSNGMQFDENGFIRPFLKNSTKMQFEKMAKCVIDQYDGVQVLLNNNTTNRVNGELTFDENMADISGFEAASRAFEMLKRDGKLSEKPKFNHPNLRGLTQDQLFFLGVTNVFCNKQDNDYIYWQIHNDPHTPNPARAYSFTNVPAFGKAFNCPVGSKYRSTKYCKVWT